MTGRQRHSRFPFRAILVLAFSGPLASGSRKDLAAPASASAENLEFDDYHIDPLSSEAAFAMFWLANLGIYR